MYDLPKKGHAIMLMHEWIRYRSQQVKQALDDEDKPVGPEEDAATEEHEGEVAPREEAREPDEASEPAEAPVAEAALAAEAEAVRETAASRADERERAAQAAPARAESTVRDREAVLSSLQEELERTGNSMRERLSKLQAHQRQLPIEVDEDEDEDGEERPQRATETRQELVQRLLDPTLTLREAALLLDVCPTTVRRYTNRGLLNCFRTPGNQRRFHLSDVLEFLERRQQGEI